jgi:hypothetical protein
MLNNTSADNEIDLLPQHDNDPIYIPALKSALTMGHFIVFNSMKGWTIVATILQQSESCDNLLIPTILS